MGADLEQVFELIKAAIARATEERSYTVAADAAMRNGLVELGDGTPSQLHTWERCDAGQILRFTWRWYDPSQAFSIRPDVNILSLELRQGNAVLRKHEERYED
jgi:hypothetical protein